MLTIEQRLKLLSGAPAPVVAAALTEAVRYAEEDELEALAAAMTVTGTTAAVASVIGMLHRMGPSGMRCLEDVRRQRAEIISRVVSGGRDRARRNAATVVGRWGDATALPALIPLLGADNNDVRQSTAMTIFSVTLNHVGRHGVGQPEAEQAAALDGALAQAAESFGDHREDLVTLAVALASHRPGPNLADVLAASDTPIRMALSRIPARVDQDLVRRNLLRWLTCPAIGRQVVRNLPQIKNAAAWGDVLQGGHLLLTASRRSSLKKAERAIGNLPDQETAQALLPEAQRILPRYTAALGLSDRMLARHLGQMSGLGSPIARMAAIRQLLDRAGRSACPAIAEFMQDETPQVARTAFRGLDALGRWDAQDLESQTHSAHPSIARAARRRRARADLDGFRTHWQQLPEIEVMACARVLLARKREEMTSLLQELLRCDDAPSKLRAIMICRRLGLGLELHRSIIIEMKGAAPRVTSAAIAALGAAIRSDACPEPVAQILKLSLRHDDARVRANAVEAFGGEPEDSVRSRLLAMSRDDRNRPRGNAVRTALRFAPDAGLEGLEAMLNDQDPLHRISAIWVARRARVAAATPALERLARDDRFRVIRRRAAAAVTLVKHPGQCAGATA